MEDANNEKVKTFAMFCFIIFECLSLLYLHKIQITTNQQSVMNAQR